MTHTVSREVGSGHHNTFGPQLGAQFDFTLLFEDTILTILPASLLIATCPLYILHYLKQPVYVSGGFVLWTKLGISVALLALHIAGAALWTSLPTLRSDATLPAASLVCISTICIIALVYLEHRRSVSSSVFISLYLASTLLLDIVKSRSYFSTQSLQTIAGLSAASCVVKLALLLLEEVSKRAYIKDGAVRESVSRETTCGFWTRALFLWLNPTLTLGYKTILQVDDLGYLGDNFSSEYLAAKFEPIWAKYKHSSNALIKSCFLTFIRPFSIVFIPRLLYMAFSFSQPLLLQRIVRFIGDSNASTSVRNGLIGATILIYLGLAITRASFNHLNYRLVYRLRGVLVSAIFKKTLALEQVHAKRFAAVTLMSTDIDGIAINLRKFFDICAGVLEVGVGTYLLTRIVGKATFLVVFPAIMSAMVGFFSGKHMGPARIAWNKEIENRVSVTSSILQQIKSIKMVGLEPVVVDLVQRFRHMEMQSSKRFRMLYTIVQATVFLCYQITPVIVITVAIFWTNLSNGLNATDTFTALAFLTMVAFSMARLLDAYPRLMSGLACFQRIETYLLLDEWQDGRLTIQSQASYDSEKGTPGIDPSNDLALPLSQHPINLQPLKPPIEFADASIAAQGTDVILENVNISIPHLKLTVIVGRTGSGKSTLLRAMLGEAVLTNGSIYIRDRDHQIAYCDQSPWLRNSSIRENIIVDKMYTKDWYDTVLNACLLDDDLRQLPNGDQTIAGEGGSNLSGGQKQRIALARAVYSQASIFILDNIFSALDRNTADAIFHRLFGLGGLLQRLDCTIVMTTHLAEHIDSADQVLLIEGDGSVKSIFKSRDALHSRKDIAGSLSAVSEENETNQLPEKKKERLGTPNDKSPIRQRGDYTLYSFYLNSTAKWLWIVWIVAVALVAVAERLPEIFIRIWLEVAPENKVYVAGYIVFGFGTFALTGLTLGLYFLKIVPESSQNLHRVLLDSVMGSTLSFLSYSNTGSILNLFSQDMSLISQDLPLTFFIFLDSFFLLMTDIGIIAAGATYVAITIPFIFACLYILQNFYLRTSRQMRRLDLESKTPLYTLFTEMTAGLAHIRSFKWQYLSQSLHALDYSQKPFYYMFCIQRWLNLVSDLFVLGIATILVSIALCVQNTTSQNAIGLALLTVIQFGDSVTALINTWINMETSLGAVARIRSFVQDTPSEEDGTSAGTALPSGCLKRGEIEMVDVTATYNSSAVSTTALQNVSLKIKPGQKVAVRGRTGSGKSSLILTLLNFLDYEGVIRLDGVDLTQIPRRTLRSLITTISQDTVELPGTVRYNIVPERGTPLPDHISLGEVLDIVKLRDHIDAHGGLDAPVANMGFSHGQKQMLAIARAILHKLMTNSGLLLMDEATSSMDLKTAEEMQQVINEAFGDCTVITISHRHENIDTADVIIDIENGKIIHIEEQRSSKV